MEIILIYAFVANTVTVALCIYLIYKNKKDQSVINNLIIDVLDSNNVYKPQLTRPSPPPKTIEEDVFLKGVSIVAYGCGILGSEALFSDWLNTLAKLQGVTPNTLLKTSKGLITIEIELGKLQQQQKIKL